MRRSSPPRRWSFRDGAVLGWNRPRSHEQRDGGDRSRRRAGGANGGAGFAGDGPERNAEASNGTSSGATFGGGAADRRTRRGRGSRAVAVVRVPAFAPRGAEGSLRAALGRSGIRRRRVCAGPRGSGPRSPRLLGEELAFPSRSGQARTAPASGGRAGSAAHLARRGERADPHRFAEGV